ncbi:MAG: 4a-hydroxytetrahydrobiopterin dehydratase [Rhizobiaceae bacterium]|nr:MAG: 4a-hydroxytetrahydrobiopterin dehydratase [Rhizobiaceae bacterium]
MAREKLSTTEIARRIQELDGWVLSDDAMAIGKTFKFGNFAEAFAFMTQSAIHAEKMDHHPEWSNVYRTVEVKLTTHSAKGLTELDFDLAGRMDKAARH